LAQDVGVSAQVHFLGEIGGEALVPYYKSADVFVLPSIARSEAFGIVQLEAMAAGVPVINTALDSGVPQVSLDQQTGLTVDPKDPGALQGALRRLLEDRALRARFGEAGRRRVVSEFSDAAMVQRVLAVYEKAAPAWGEA
jgi:rhamnosyl/mannosyltransferase